MGNNSLKMSDFPFRDDEYYVALHEQRRIIAIIQKWRDDLHIQDMNPINVLNYIIKEIENE